MKKTVLITGALLGLLSVIFGAFGAHGLKEQIDEASISTFEIAVKYQMYHSLVLLFIGMTDIFSGKAIKILWILFLTGILLFSGSIYGLATNSLSSFFDFKTIGFITPIGGVFLIAGWGVLLYKFMTLKMK